MSFFKSSSSHQSGLSLLQGLTVLAILGVIVTIVAKQFM